MSCSRPFRTAAECGIALTAIATLILAGCGGGGGGVSGSVSTTTSTTVTPFKGMFQSGSVTLFDANGNQVPLSAGGNINASGVASVTFPASVTYPLTVCVNGVYLDETQGNTPVSMGSGTCLRGLVPSATEAASGVPVTAVTEIARAMLPSSGVTYASAVAAITGAASSVLGTANYSQAMLPPVFNNLGQTTDPQTIRLAALAHVINQQGTGGNLVLRLQNLTASLVAGSSVNAVFPQGVFASAVATVNSMGASGVLPASATPPTVTVPILPGTSLANQIQNSGTSGGGTGAPTPTITGFSPNSGAVGTTVTITGTNLVLGFPPAPTVKFGTTNAGGPYTNVSNTGITFTVPAGLAVGTYNLTIGGMSGSPVNVGSFAVTSNGNTPSNNSLAVKQGGFNLGVPLANLPATLAGTYDVAIYTALPESGQASSSVTGYLGLAKLVVRNTTGSYYALELKTPSGTLISRNSNDPALTFVPSFGFQLSTNNGIATIGGSNGTAIATSVTASFSTDGTITGSAPGNFGIGMISFRNNITHFGPTAPPAFSALAGNWTGSAQALTCGQPQVTLSVLTDSSITINGQPNINCVQTPYSASWDGNDDYIIPNPAGGFKLVINANQYAATVVNGQITGPGPGALTLLINDALSPTAISDVELLYGSGGNIQSVNLIKQ